VHDNSPRSCGKDWIITRTIVTMRLDRPWQAVVYYRSAISSEVVLPPRTAGKHVGRLSPISHASRAVRQV